MLADKPLVLVAEDDPDISSLLAFQLERAGFEVLLAEDGHQALELLRQWHPSVALIDVHMPKLDGPESSGASELTTT